MFGCFLRADCFVDLLLVPGTESFGWIPRLVAHLPKHLFFLIEEFDHEVCPNIHHLDMTPELCPIGSCSLGALLISHPFTIIKTYSVTVAMLRWVNHGLVFLVEILFERGAFLNFNAAKNSFLWSLKRFQNIIFIIAGGILPLQFPLLLFWRHYCF